MRQFLRLPTGKSRRTLHQIFPPQSVCNAPEAEFACGARGIKSRALHAGTFFATTLAGVCFFYNRARAKGSRVVLEVRQFFICTYSGGGWVGSSRGAPFCCLPDTMRKASAVDCPCMRIWCVQYMKKHCSMQQRSVCAGQSNAWEEL